LQAQTLASIKIASWFICFILSVIFLRLFFTYGRLVVKCKYIVFCLLFLFLLSPLSAFGELPAPQMGYCTSGVNVLLEWTPVSGANRYSLSFAPFPYTGPESIVNWDLGNATTLSTELWDGAAYYIAIQAHAGAQSSVYSNVGMFTTTASSGSGAQQTEDSQMIIDGELIFNSGCNGCHSAHGQGYVGGSNNQFYGGDITNADSEQISTAFRSTSIMSFYRYTLSNASIELVASYLASTNDSGDEFMLCDPWQGQVIEGEGVSSGLIDDSLDTTAIIDIAGGDFKSMALQNDGTVLTWGSGLLGDGTYASRMTPEPISVDNAVAISSGGYHAYALLDNGSVVSWGKNFGGALGNGSTDESASPIAVQGIDNVIQVDGGSSNGAALKADGTVWVWGYNSYGVSANGSTEDLLVPVQVPGIDNVTSISNNGSIVAAIKSDGTLWGWGNGVYGQLGNNWTGSFQTPAPFIGLRDIVAVDISFGSTFALKSDGTVWACGYNLNGELGDGTTEYRKIAVQVSELTDIVSIDAGVWHALALKADGTVWAWGRNSDAGVLGSVSIDQTLVPVQVVGLENIKSISAGNDTNFAIDEDGKVWAWGWNGSGKLGDGTSDNILVPKIIENL
jgi:alpha-tubulin suppressor-like RCC1 family protein/mono/diheme cytochrome c family protein